MTEPNRMWRKARASAESNSCVQLADAGDHILVRDSKDPDGPRLRFTRGEMRAWIAGCKAGEFDDLG